MIFTLGFSPCPNDTFIFDALVNKKIDTEGIEFKVQLEDVQTLNELAINDTLDLTKISYGVLPLVLKNYLVMQSGSALGSGVGPLLVAKELYSSEEIEDCKVAIPGENTTAHMLFKMAYPGVKNKVYKRYDQIEGFVLEDCVEGRAGVIIHENRFTYQEKGLKKIVDLGEYWEEKTGSPIPLGGIIGKRSIDKTLLKKVDSLIKNSIEYAFEQYPNLNDYIRLHSQEMSKDVMRKHIDLYVNKYSLSLGTIGMSAIEQFMMINKTSYEADDTSSTFLV